MEKHLWIKRLVTNIANKQAKIMPKIGYETKFVYYGNKVTIMSGLSNNYDVTLRGYHNFTFDFNKKELRFYWDCWEFDQIIIDVLKEKFGDITINDYRTAREKHFETLVKK